MATLRNGILTATAILIAAAVVCSCAGRSRQKSPSSPPPQPQDDLETEVSVIVNLAEGGPLSEGIRTIEQYALRLAAFHASNPGSKDVPEIVSLVRKYLFDGASPLRDEDLYLPFVSVVCEMYPEGSPERIVPEWEKAMCSMNRVGSKAADFVFMGPDGRKGHLYGVEGDPLILVFGNPDCTACKELIAAFEADPVLLDTAVLSMYIDEDVDAWRSHLGDYPSSWTLAYDPAMVLRGNTLYHIPAIPSVYLLSADKTVLLKDKSVSAVLHYLNTTLR